MYRRTGYFTKALQAWEESWNLSKDVTEVRMRAIADRVVAEFAELNSRLSTHHRVHGIAVMLEVEEALGRWDRIAGLTGRVEERVDANLTTPCVRNSRSLFVCALANTYVGDKREARRLEDRAEELSFEGFGLTLDGPRIRLALTRGDLELVERLVEGRLSSAFYLGSQTALLDGLAAIGARERVEAAAEPILRPGTYLEPFALRALGLVRGRAFREARPHLARRADASPKSAGVSGARAGRARAGRVGRRARDTGFPRPRRASRRHSSP